AGGRGPCARGHGPRLRLGTHPRGGQPLHQGAHRAISVGAASHAARSRTDYVSPSARRTATAASTAVRAAVSIETNSLTQSPAKNGLSPRPRSSAAWARQRPGAANGPAYCHFLTIVSAMRPRTCG